MPSYTWIKSAAKLLSHLDCSNKFAGKAIRAKTRVSLFVAACQQVKHGVQAVFGPSDPILGQHIHSICDALDIPHLEARLDLETEAKEFSINLYPAQSLLNAAYQDIMEFLNWTKVVIIYEDDYGERR